MRITDNFFAKESEGESIQGVVACENVADRESAHARAVEVADVGDYDAARNAIIHEDLLPCEVARISEYYGGRLEGATWMTPEDWEMLAVLNCYDERTAEHCVNTYVLAKNKAEEIKISGWSIADLISKEGVLLEQFYRSCLFHDIGKCSIPRSLLNNTLRDAEWNERLDSEIFEKHNTKILELITQKIGGDPFPEGGREELPKYLSAHHERAMHFVPIADVVEGEDLDRIMKTFPDIDPDTNTLADIIAKHESESGRILIANGRIIEGALAAEHHNREHRISRYPITSDTLHVSATWAEVLKLADVTQALSAARSYKSGWSVPIACEKLLEEVEGDDADVLAALWINSEFAHMDVSGYTVEDLAALARVNDFLAHTEQKIRLAEAELEAKFPHR